MPTSKKVSRYPSTFLNYIESGFKNGLTITCKDQAAASTLRLRLYGFREALRAEGHQYLWFADQLSMIVRGPRLILQRSDVDSQSTIISVELGQQAPVDAPMIQQPSVLQPISKEELARLEKGMEQMKEKDPMETALEKLGFFAGVSKKEKK